MAAQNRDDELNSRQITFAKEVAETKERWLLIVAAYDYMDVVVRLYAAKNEHTPLECLLELATRDPDHLVRSNGIANPSTPLESLLRTLESDDDQLSEEAKTILHLDRYDEWLDHISDNNTPIEVLYRAMYSSDYTIRKSVCYVLNGSRSKEWHLWKQAYGLSNVIATPEVDPFEWITAMLTDLFAERQ